MTGRRVDMDLYERPVATSAMLLRGLRLQERRGRVGRAETLLGPAWEARLSLEAELEFRPASWTAWEISGEGEFTNGQEAWMTNEDLGQGAHSIFADRDTRAISATVRGSVTFHRDMTLQFYSQVFTAKGRYRNPRILQTASSFGPFTGTVSG